MLIKKIVSVILSLSLVFMVSGCQSDKDTPLHSFHFQKIKKFVFLKVTSCIYY